MPNGLILRGLVELRWAVAVVWDEAREVVATTRVEALKQGVGCSSPKRLRWAITSRCPKAGIGLRQPEGRCRQRSQDVLEGSTKGAPSPPPPLALHPGPSSAVPGGVATPLLGAPPRRRLGLPAASACGIIGGSMRRGVGGEEERRRGGRRKERGQRPIDGDHPELE